MEEPDKRNRWREVPDPARLSSAHARHADIIERHGAALAARLPTYVDPVSGFSVFTSDFLARRRYCCESGCRHCPYVDTGRSDAGGTVGGAGVSGR